MNWFRLPSPTGCTGSCQADGGTEWLEAAMADLTDGNLVHLDGLNLSHVWMLEGIAAGLPKDDDRRPSLITAATVHWVSGLASPRRTSIRCTVTQVEK